MFNSNFFSVGYIPGARQNGEGGERKRAEEGEKGRGRVASWLLGDGRPRTEHV